MPPDVCEGIATNNARDDIIHYTNYGILDAEKYGFVRMCWKRRYIKKLTIMPE